MSQLYETLNLKDRIREVFIGTEVIIFLALIGNYYNNNDLIVVGLLLLVFFLMLAPIIALTNNKITLANGLFLSILCISLVAIIWFNHGIKDTGLLAFPALIIYAAILGTSRQFYATTIFLTASVIFVGFAHLLNLKTFASPDVSMVDLVDIPLILLITALALRALFMDVRLQFDKFTALDASSNGDKSTYEDQLTGLPGRRIAEDYFNRAIIHQQNTPGSWLSVLSVDLDDFRPINENYGYDVGDALLFEISRRFKALLGKEDNVYRFSGDEFKFIIRSTPNVASFARSIKESLAEHFAIGPYKLKVTASIGIYEVTTPNEHYSQAFKRAEIAMLQRKVDKGDGLKFYDAVSIDG
jgi:diguanylate cyclase (GGDEF)-like protein